jgi:hypothetical protein
MGLRQCWIEIKSLFQNLLCPQCIAFLNANSANVDPTIGIRGSISVTLRKPIPPI